MHRVAAEGGRRKRRAGALCLGLSLLLCFISLADRLRAEPAHEAEEDFLGEQGALGHAPRLFIWRGPFSFGPALSAGFGWNISTPLTGMWYLNGELSTSFGVFSRPTATPEGYDPDRFGPAEQRMRVTTTLVRPQVGFVADWFTMRTGAAFGAAVGAYESGPCGDATYRELLLGGTLLGGVLLGSERRLEISGQVDLIPISPPDCVFRERELFLDASTVELAPAENLGLFAGLGISYRIF